MVPRPDMVSVRYDRVLRQAMSLFLRSGFSRVPVIGEGSDDVLGILYFKDVARAVNANADASSVPVSELMRPVQRIPESKSVDSLLREMQRDRLHIAIVIDEYGGTAGLITIEDIVEEIVGEITDEYDVAERPPVERLEDGAVRVTARLPVEDLGELFGVELETGEVETVAGLLAQALGRVPIPGATAVIGGLRLLAEGTTGRRNRIDTVLVQRVESGGRGGPATDRETDVTQERQPADA